MIENTTYIKCRPSQLVNLRHFITTLLLVPLLIILHGTISEIMPSKLIPDNIEDYILRLPLYVVVAAILKLGYHILKTRCTHYEINPEELQHSCGILRRKHGYIELYRIKDFQVDRPLIYRFFGLGNLIVYTSDKTTPVFRLEAVRNPEEIYTVLRGLVELNRREKHVFEID
jgi:uncharacterized membrane protein YdbT with pleckstrin-like domain